MGSTPIVESAIWRIRSRQRRSMSVSVPVSSSRPSTRRAPVILATINLMASFGGNSVIASRERRLCSPLRGQRCATRSSGVGRQHPRFLPTRIRLPPPISITNNSVTNRDCPERHVARENRSDFFFVARTAKCACGEKQHTPYVAHALSMICPLTNPVRCPTIRP